MSKVKYLEAVLTRYMFLPELPKGQNYTMECEYLKDDLRKITVWVDSKATDVQQSNGGEK